MSEIPWDLLFPQVGWIAVFLTVLIASCGLFYTFGRWQENIKRQFEKIEKPLKLLLLIHRKELVDSYFDFFGIKSNPHLDKEFLLRKLRDGTITHEESLRLKTILEEEKKQAEKKGGNIGGLLIILGLLLLLAILLGGDEQESNTL